MATNTTNIALKKPASSEKVNLSDINANWDKIDAAFGNLGSGNSVKGLLDTESTASRYGQSTSSWDAAVEALNNNFGSVSASSIAEQKARVLAIADAIQTIADSAPNNSFNSYDVSASYTYGGTTSTVSGTILLIKKTSGSYFAGLFIPYAFSIPFYIRRYNTTRGIRLLV